MEKKVFTKDEISTHFTSSNKVEVIFEKKDGSLRTMICTRDMASIPEEYRPGDSEEVKTRVKKTADHLFPVFDLEKNGWRSFTVAKVKSVTPIQTEPSDSKE